MKIVFVLMVLNGFLFAGGYVSSEAENSKKLDGYNYDYFASSFNPVFTGNVGIGTMSPIAKLEVIGGDIYTWNAGGNSRFLFGDSASSGDYGGIRWDSGGDYISVYTDSAGANQLVLKESGNVGIGTKNPQTKLQISTSATSGYSLGFAGAVQTLPTTGFPEGTMIYQVSDHTAYISTETVTSAGSWRSVW